MTKEEFLLHKAKAISASLEDTAKALIQNSKSKDSPEEINIRSFLICEMGRAEICKIMAQPMPTYKKGTV